MNEIKETMQDMTAEFDKALEILKKMKLKSWK
jgi:hypothetical protein